MPVAVPTRRDATVGGDVVATVNGVPITVAEVREAAQSAGIPALVALRRLEDEIALSDQASVAGVARDPEIEAAARRALVRALMHRVIEPANTPEGISAADVEERHGLIRGALSAPQTRRATHVLVALARDADPARVDAATRLARQIRDELASDVNPAAAADQRVGREGAFDVTVEHLDAMPQAQLEAPFADALFAAPALGVLPDVVRTSYGVHVIVLEEIVAPWEVPPEEWEPMIRRQIAAERRAAAVEELAQRLASGTSVAIETQAAALAEHVPLGGDDALGAP